MFNYNQQQNNNFAKHKPLYEPVYARNIFNKEQIKEFLIYADNLQKQPAQIGSGTNGTISNFLLVNLLRSSQV